jgi:TatD DNase family protein
LDYYRPAEVTEEVKRAQHEVLRAHIALAVELDKPLIIHLRPSSAKATQGKPSYDAYFDLIKILKEAKIKHPNVRGDIHFFVGTPEIAKELFALGFTVSFTAVITFARDYDEIIRQAPLEMILSETDSPYVPPTNRARGSRNDPLVVEDVVAKIAEIRGEDPETVRVALLQNAQNLFQIRHF